MLYSFLILIGLVTIALLPSNAIILNPEDILIATVVDLSSPGIIRDAVTLLRSMRLYGGSINKACFVVCITMKPGYQEVDANIIATFTNLGAQITYIHEVPAPKAKTLNKFKAFEQFDSLKYSHFLWLDADIVVFEDPMPYLVRHMSPGKIDCVPDFYSYMRRYPGLNETDLMWNGTLLPDVVMVGDQQEVSHGHCNTGVLFFDSLSLHAFLNGLNELYKSDSELFVYNDQNNIRGADPLVRRRNLMADRFIDSLLFVAIVNKFNIEVGFLSHAMNYMLYFEGEISQDTTTNNVVFAHLLSASEIYCREENTGVFLQADKALHYVLMDASVQALALVNDLGLFNCQCKYVNENHNNQLLGFTYITRLTREYDCLAMAGFLDGVLKVQNGIDVEDIIEASDPVSSNIVESRAPTAQTAASAPDVEVVCEIVSPMDSSRGEHAVSLIRHIDGLDYLSFWWTEGSDSESAPSADAGAESPELLFQDSVDTLSVHLTCRATGSTDRWILKSDQVGIIGAYSVSLTNPNDDVECEDENASGGPIEVHRVRHDSFENGTMVHLQFDLVLAGLLDHLLGSGVGRGSVPAASFIRLSDLTLTIPVHKQPIQGEQPQATTTFVTVPVIGRHSGNDVNKANIVIKLINSNKTTRGIIAYENNLLLGNHLDVSVPSTDKLHKFLNKFLLSAEPGVIMCCDHISTVRTIVGLIRHWKGSKLVIYASSVPVEFSISPADYLSKMSDSETNVGVGVDPVLEIGTVNIEKMWLRYLQHKVDQAYNVRKSLLLNQLRRFLVLPDGTSVPAGAMTPELVQEYEENHSISIVVVPTSVTQLEAITVDPAVGTAFKSHWSDSTGLLRMLMQHQTQANMVSTVSNSFSFVLLDSFHSATFYRDSVRFWFDKLVRYGLLLGPSDSVLDTYWETNLNCVYSSDTGYTARNWTVQTQSVLRKQLLDLKHIRNVVDQFMIEKKHILLHTHASTAAYSRDNRSSRCDNSTDTECRCLRSLIYIRDHMQLWYTIKHK